jgi:threonine dehydrogenase-like Zn-dependent dehydrogenase
VIEMQTLSEQAGTSRGTMRAAVLVDVGRLELHHEHRPIPAPHEVLVRVQAVGLCGTDLHIVAGHANYNRDEAGQPRPLREHPQILGHEIAGLVVEAGSRVTDLTAGYRVVIDQGRSCVSEQRDPVCEYCRTGDSHQCEHYREHGITGLPGGFAEFVAVPAVNAVRIETHLAPECAALTEPLGCVIHATEMLSRAASRYGLATTRGQQRARAILICGGGPAGLLFVQYLRHVAGFDGTLILSEPNAAKRALAERFGATTVNPESTNLVEAVADLTQGRRVELLIEASGAGAIFGSIPGLVRKQATILLYGHGHAGADLSVMNQVQFLEPSLVSPVGASGGHDVDGRPLTYVRALRLIEEGRVDVESLITHRYPSLASVPRAFSGDHRAPGYVKGVVIL